MKKKIALIMALALSVTTVFAGCGAKDDQKQRESGSGTQKTFTVGFDPVSYTHLTLPTIA